MRPLPTILGLLFVVSGAVWILQGLDVAFAPGSFMTGDRKWVVYGVLTLASGLVLVVWSRRT